MPKWKEVDLLIISDSDTIVTREGRVFRSYPTAKKRRWHEVVVTQRIARLICEVYHGPQPSPLHWVLHKDDDRSNPRPDNLYWGTRSDNLRDAWQNERRNPIAIELQRDVNNIIAEYQKGQTLSEIAAEYGTNAEMIRRIIPREFIRPARRRNEKA